MLFICFLVHTTDQDHIITGNGTDKINRVETVRKQLCHVMDDNENELGNSISSKDGFLAAVEKFCSTYWKIRGKLTHPSNKQ